MSPLVSTRDEPAEHQRSSPWPSADGSLPRSAEEQLLRVAVLMPFTRATGAEEAAMRPPPAPSGVGAGVRCTYAVAADAQRRASEGSSWWGHGALARQITAVRP